MLTLSLPPRSFKNCYPAGFTLIEILVVVVLLGIIAAIALPSLTNATTEAREKMLREDLRVIRTQISSYSIQHEDVSPGYPDGNTAAAPTADAFVQQMTKFTDINGFTNNTKTARFRYGPYFSSIPRNTINDLNTIRVLADHEPIPAVNNDEIGWVYKPAEMDWRAGCVGNDTQGQSFFDY